MYLLLVILLVADETMSMIRKIYRTPNSYYITAAIVSSATPLHLPVFSTLDPHELLNLHDNSIFYLF